MDETFKLILFDKTFIFTRNYSFTISRQAKEYMNSPFDAMYSTQPITFRILKMEDVHKAQQKLCVKPIEDYTNKIYHLHMRSIAHALLYKVELFRHGHINERQLIAQASDPTTSCITTLQIVFVDNEPELCVYQRSANLVVMLYDIEYLWKYLLQQLQKENTLQPYFHKFEAINWTVTNLHTSKIID